MKKVLTSLVIVMVVLLGGCKSDSDNSKTFTVRIRNISDTSSLATPLAPGIWVVHSNPYVLFQEGQKDYVMGLENLAEDGNPGVLASNLGNVSSLGVFNTPSGASGPGVLLPGSNSVYEFSFTASPGDRLSFATMFVQSNDLFFAPSDEGIDLFGSAGSKITSTSVKAISGDITDQIMLWDGGTEVNEEPGFGPNQAPRQPAPNTGPTENGVVRLVDDGFSYPAVNQLIEVTITQ